VWDCECGGSITVRNSDVINGNTRSCGCLQPEVVSQRSRTHGQSNTLIYGVYSSMLGRCNNPTDKAFVNYGGRGIRVCEQWQGPDGFVRFTQDMGERPAGKMLERRDNNGPYSPDNCYWATRKEQNRNTRHNRVFTVKGFTGCVTELCERFHVPFDVAYYRLRKGWPVERVFATA
jgi:hypothetical protein